VAAGFRAQRFATGVEADAVEFGQRLARDTIDRRRTFQLRGIFALANPGSAHWVETTANVRCNIRIAVRSTGIVEPVALAVRQFNLTKRNAKCGLVPVNVHAPRARLRRSFSVRCNRHRSHSHYTRERSGDRSLRRHDPDQVRRSATNIALSARYAGS